MSNIVLEVASPPDREKLVVQFMIRNEQLAELNQENETLQLEIYGRRDGQPWIIAFPDFLSALADARDKLASAS